MFGPSWNIQQNNPKTALIYIVHIDSHGCIDCLKIWREFSELQQ